MENRHSSPSARAFSPRPRTHRKRSNSLPIVEALGCSTPEAELLLAEGRAAIRHRQTRRGRRNRSLNDETTNFQPRDHINYLHSASAVSGHVDKESLSSPDHRSTGHTRVLSNVTDRSTSTVIHRPVEPGQLGVEEAHSAKEPPGGQLGDYSARLAMFIQSQLNSIPSYSTTHTSISPRSCPDLTYRSRTPSQSPTRSMRRLAGMPNVLEIPPIRPPLRSAFSTWSSTDDDTDNEVPPLPVANPPRSNSKASTYTPSLLGYYEHANESFLFTSTPLGDEEGPLTAKDFSFPGPPVAPETTSESYSSAQDGDDYPSSAISTRPQLTSSSAPSFSSASTASYFDYKRPISLAPDVRDRIIAAVTPHHSNGKMFPATSPFEGGALANVHDILIESQQRVLVDGMSFDMLRDFSIPDEGMRRVPTPC